MSTTLSDIKQAIDRQTRIIWVIAIAPLTVLGLAGAGYMLWHNKISEWNFLLCVLLFSSPFFGEGIKAILKINSKSLTFLGFICPIIAIIYLAHENLYS